MTAYELTAGSPVRALSFYEPFGSLVANYGKEETRRRNTNVQGWVLICTCRKPYSDATIRLISGLEQYERVFLLCRHSQYVNGKAIAIARLTSCREMDPRDQDKTFVRYRPGLFVWKFEDVFPVVPLPWRGSQGWTYVNPEYLKSLIIKR